MSKNQNNISNKGSSFIPHINNDLPTLPTYDPCLKSSMQSSHNNSKILELFDKSSVVDFTIDEILIDLGNEQDNNPSILLFCHKDEQDISNAPFKSSSLISHEREQDQRREQKCAKVDFSGCGQFKTVRLTSPEDRKLSKSFNDTASSMNKTKY